MKYELFREDFGRAYDFVAVYDRVADVTIYSVYNSHIGCYIPHDNDVCNLRGLIKSVYDGYSELEALELAISILKKTHEKLKWHQENDFFDDERRLA